MAHVVKVQSTPRRSLMNLKLRIFPSHLFVVVTFRRAVVRGPLSCAILSVVVESAKNNSSELSERGPYVVLIVEFAYFL